MDSLVLAQAAAAFAVVVRVPARPGVLALIAAALGIAGVQLVALAGVIEDPAPGVHDAIGLAVPVGVLTLLVWRRGRREVLRGSGATLVAALFLAAFALMLYGASRLIGAGIAEDVAAVHDGFLWFGLGLGALFDLLYLAVACAVTWWVYQRRRPRRATVLGIAGIVVASGLVWLSFREVPGEERAAAELMARGHGRFDVLLVVDPHDPAGRAMIAQATSRRDELASARGDRVNMDIAFALAVLGPEESEDLYETVLQPTDRATMVDRLADVSPMSGPPAYRSYGRVFLDAQRGGLGGVQWRPGTRRAVVFATSALPSEQAMQTPAPSGADTARACRETNASAEAQALCERFSGAAGSFAGFAPDAPVPFATAMSSYERDVLIGESPLIPYGQRVETLTLNIVSPLGAPEAREAWRAWTERTGGSLLDPATYGAQPLLHTMEDVATGEPPPSAAALAAIYRPHLRFADGERSAPVDVDALLRGGADSEDTHRVCSHRTGPDDCVPVRSAAELLGDRIQYIDFAGDVRDEAARRREAGLPPRMYVDIRLEENRLYLGYWWYFTVNSSPVAERQSCLPGFTVSDLTCFDHEGDWEGVTVALVPASAAPPRAASSPPTAYDADAWTLDWVGYDAHGRTIRWGQERLRAAGVLAGSTHPEVFVAYGSHASYPVPCRGGCRQWLSLEPNLPEGRFPGSERWPHNRARRCNGERHGHDGARDGDGPVRAESTLCLFAMPSTRRARLVIGSERPDDPQWWNAFPGRWGAARCVLAKVCTQGDGPRTPSRQLRYTKPWTARTPSPAAERRFEQLVRDACQAGLIDPPHPASCLPERASK